MALIKCSECGKEISDQASACPNCGSPTAFQKKRRKGIESMAVLAGILGVTVFVFSYQNYCNRHIPYGLNLRASPFLKVLKCTYPSFK